LRVIPVLVCMMGFSTALVAQSDSVAGSVKVVPSDWERVKQLRQHTRVHLSTDRGSHLCSVDSVDDVSLTCSWGHSGKTYPRAEIKSIKVTEYALSTLGGALIGAGGREHWLDGVAAVITGAQDLARWLMVLLSARARR
jgi:hypothetical protein